MFLSVVQVLLLLIYCSLSLAVLLAGVFIPDGTLQPLELLWWMVGTIVVAVSWPVILAGIGFICVGELVKSHKLWRSRYRAARDVG